MRIEDTSAGYRDHFWHAQDDLVLYARCYGDPTATRVPVVCLPGLTRHSADFHGLAAVLAAQGHLVLCPDYRGRGRSAFAADWRSYRGPALVRDLLAMLAAHNLHRAIFIGTSLGGLLAMGLATAQPTCVVGVVLNDVGPSLAPDGLERIRTYVADDRPLGDWLTAIHRLQMRFPNLGLKTEADWEAFARATFREGSEGRLHISWDPRIAKTLTDTEAAHPSLWQLFRALHKVPTLALRGDQSDVLSADTFDAMQAAKPDLQRVTVPEIGHAPTLDEPVVRDRLAAFLAELAD